MFQSAIEISRAWSSGLNRLGWGSLCVLFLGFSFNFIDKTFAVEIASGGVTARSVVNIIMFYLSSNLLGAMVVSLGSNTLNRKYSVKSNAMRAFKVSETRNELFIQTFQESVIKFEVACGLRGTFLFIPVVFLFSDVTGNLPSLPDALTPLQAFSDRFWDFITFLVVLAFGLVIQYTATNSLDAIDSALIEIEARKKST